MSTFMANAQNVERKWYIIDAKGKPLGRVASQVAHVLRGKHKPTFTTHVDTGDFVIVINCKEAVLTGKKLEQKMYRHHTGYVGGLKETPYKVIMEKKPELAMTKAVQRMLPKNRLGKAMLKKLRVYAGSEHTHEGQQPEVYEIKI
ncbi:MAG: 50S ribosomal protein L13 [Eubacteriales bacterium]